MCYQTCPCLWVSSCLFSLMERLQRGYVKQLSLSRVSRNVWEKEEGRGGQWMVSGCTYSSLARSPGISSLWLPGSCKARGEKCMWRAKGKMLTGSSHQQWEKPGIIAAVGSSIYSGSLDPSSWEQHRQSCFYPSCKARQWPQSGVAHKANME